MRLLIDTNVVIDFLLAKGNGEIAKEIFLLAEFNKAYECISSSSITDVLYIITKARRKANKELPEQLKKTNKVIKRETQEDVEALLSFLHIVDVTPQNIKDMFSLKWDDPEDALQYVVAKANNADIIITGNTKDFKNSTIPVMSPKEFMDAYYNDFDSNKDEEFIK